MHRLPRGSDARPFAPIAALRAVSQRLRVRGSRLRERAGALLQRHFPSESQHLFALTIGVGVVCGFVAVAFHLGIKAAESLLIDRALRAPGKSWMAWAVISPTVGGLVAGAILTFVVPGARGSGIPQVKAAFALEGGRVRFRDAFGKFWVAILQIGSGASLGREGPTAQICAGAASLLARLTALPVKDTRRLLPVGVAAGIAAAFNAPIAAVTFTIEEIVGSLDHAVLSGVVIAAALAAVIERGVLGVHPIIEVQQPYGLDHPSSLVFYALLGIAGGLVSIVFTDGLLGLRQWFRSFSAIPQWSHPAVGGLVTGSLAVLVMKFLGTTGVTGGGYATLGRALGGQVGLTALLALCAAKGIATVFSYSSGGAGGIFAPVLFVGAMLGGAMGYLDVAAFHHEGRELGAFALVGMGAVFAGVIRAPITSVLIIFEMTGGYGLVLPLMLSNITAYVLARRYRATPIYEALLEQDGVVLPQASPRGHPLEQLTVADAMTARVVSVRATGTAGEEREAFASRSFQILPVLDDRGGLLGTVPLADLRLAPAATPVSQLVQRVEAILADVPLARAVVRMSEKAVRQMVVLDERTASRVVGILTITDLIRAHARAVGAEPARKADGRPPMGPGDVRARDLARPAQVLTGGATMDVLVGTLATSGSDVVIVQSAEGNASGVVLLEQVRDFLRDERLQRMLVAADLARPVPRVAPDATFSQLVAQCVLADAPALIVPTEPTGEGVITRAALGSVLVEWYARASAA